MSILNYAPGGTISLIYPLAKLAYLRKSSIFYPLSSGGAIFLDSPFPNMHPLVVGNYARSSQLFESGFSGFLGLTITSLV
jgi:hypothetical protein